MSRTTNVKVAAVATVLALVAAGIAWELWGGEDGGDWDDRYAEQVELIGSMRPGGEYELLSFPGRGDLEALPTFHVRLNRHGFRGPDFADRPAPGVTRIVALGDSATFGTGVAEEHRFTEVLQRRLDERRPACCEVLNVSRPGATTRQVALRLLPQAQGWGGSIVIANERWGQRPAGSPRSPPGGLPRRAGRGVRGRARRAGAPGGSDPADPVGQPVAGGGPARADPDLDAGLGGRGGGAGGRPVGRLRRAAGDRGGAALVRGARPVPRLQRIEPGDEGYPMGRLALQTDWFHPNRFGHERLAEALLPHVEAALDYRAESSSSPAESASSPAESSSSPAESSSSPAESSSSPAESSSSPSDG